MLDRSKFPEGMSVEEARRLLHTPSPDLSDEEVARKGDLLSRDLYSLHQQYNLLPTPKGG